MLGQSQNKNITIGRQSSGEEYKIDLSLFHNLFISHSHEAQLPQLFVSLIQQLAKDNSETLFSVSLSSRNSGLILPAIPESLLHVHFTHREAAGGLVNSMQEFVEGLQEEIRIRRRAVRRKAVSLTLPTLIIFIDDIFEIISFNKRLALGFLELLISGSAFQMFFIVGSSGIYRPLLAQLINMSTRLQKKLQKSWIAERNTQPLGAELVLNPDGLLFFRGRSEREYIRLYPY